MKAKDEKAEHKVRAARAAARVLRPHSYWGPAAPFDAQKIASLDSVLASIKSECLTLLTPDARALMFERTAMAVEDLTNNPYLTPGTAPRARQAKRGLVEFGTAAAALASKWRNLDHHLRQSLLLQFEGRLDPSGGGFATNYAHAKDVKQFLGSDLLGRLADAAATLVKVLDENRTRHLFEILFVWAIAEAWHCGTGQMPAAGHNTREPREGEPRNRDVAIYTPFQRYLNAATAPRVIGPAIVKDAVAAYQASFEN